MAGRKADRQAGERGQTDMLTDRRNRNANRQAGDRQERQTDMLTDRRRDRKTGKGRVRQL